VHGFHPKLFPSAEALFASTDNVDEVLCLILDVHLNDVSGIDVKRRLMRSDARLPVIFITGKDNDATRRLVEEVGCVAYLAKPFSAKSLVEVIALAEQQNTAAENSPD
jgi:FixJ family two-component response regulator